MAPVVGRALPLVVQVCARSAGRMHLDIVLPSNFEWVALPDDFTPQDRDSRNPANLGRLHAAYGTVLVAAREPLMLTGTVRAVGSGFATVTATAYPETGVGDRSSAFLIVAD